MVKILGQSLQMLPSAEKPSGDVKKPGVKNDFDAQLRQAAELYEAQFLREMLKSMRATVPESDLVPKSQGEKIFQGMLDEQYTDQWAARGGVGLADMIYDQLRGTLPQKRIPSSK